VQLEKLFSYSGEVEKCEFAGEKNEFCFVTFKDAKVRSLSSTRLWRLRVNVNGSGPLDFVSNCARAPLALTHSQFPPATSAAQALVCGLVDDSELSFQRITLAEFFDRGH